MKNITVSLEDEVYEQSRVLAAARHTTVTGLVRDYLTSLSDLAQRRETARRELLALIGTATGKVGRMPSREERHARR